MLEVYLSPDMCGYGWHASLDEYGDPDCGHAHGWSPAEALDAIIEDVRGDDAL